MTESYLGSGIRAYSVVSLSSRGDGPLLPRYMVLVSVTLAVAAIPEGIPLCMTISLSMGCSAMVNENVRARDIQLPVRLRNLKRKSVQFDANRT